MHVPSAVAMSSRARGCGGKEPAVVLLSFVVHRGEVCVMLSWCRGVVCRVSCGCCLVLSLSLWWNCGTKGKRSLQAVCQIQVRTDEREGMA